MPPHSRRDCLHLGNLNPSSQATTRQPSVLEGDPIPNLYMLNKREAGRAEDRSRGNTRCQSKGGCALSPEPVTSRRSTGEGGTGGTPGGLLRAGSSCQAAWHSGAFTPLYEHNKIVLSLELSEDRGPSSEHSSFWRSCQALRGCKRRRGGEARGCPADTLLASSCSRRLVTINPAGARAGAGVCDFLFCSASLHSIS